MKKLLSLLMLGGAFLLSGQSISVDPRRAEIICPASAVTSVKFAAAELQKHLQLITKVKLPITAQPRAGRYHFYLAPPAGTAVKLAREQAQVEITPQGTYLYGEDFQGNRKYEDQLSRMFRKNHRTGTLFAVYDFLEKQLGVKWMEPGDRGIVFTPASKLNLKCGTYSWKPAFIQRELRWGYYSYRDYVQGYQGLNREFELSKKEFEQRAFDVQVWLKRQRMGNSYYFGYGHAFTDWWDKYHQDHLDYFAVQEDGVRRPVAPKLHHTTKLCVSNRKVHDLIIQKFGGRRFINLCENDWGGYCRCPNCRKLDEPRPGEGFDDHMTDRYVWFNNQIQRRAAKINPETQVVFYAYSHYRFPPRREKIDSRIIAGFVPSMLDLAKTEKMYQGWHQMGLKQIFLRPNDHHIACGLPMGYEKQLFSAFKLGVKYGIIGTDYDSLHNFWSTCGMADYILARGHVDPTKSFEYWENEYCSIYGAAAPEVKAYYRYWRQEIWEKRLLKDKDEIIRQGRYGNFRRGLMWNLKKYYRIADFDRTDRILARAATKTLTAAERQRLAALQATNRHARLTFEAVVASGPAKLACGKKLVEFRRQHRKELNFDWRRLAKLEKDFGDITAVQQACFFQDYRDYRALSQFWYFDPDLRQVGQQEQWEKFSFAKIQMLWSRIRVNAPWEKQTYSGMPQDLKKFLRNYDGVGYYALRFTVPPEWKGQEISLFFGAVDESAWVYVNGQFSGQRLNKNEYDWKTPFAIRIDQQLDWTKKDQLVVVRVQDLAGAGGIWRPVYLVIK